MRYISTRGGGEPILSAQAIIKGLAEDGGLYVPEVIPALDIPPAELAGMDYASLAYEILKLYLTDFDPADLRDSINRAYSVYNGFDTDVIAPLVKKGDAWFLELFHGRTLAFKDMALSLMPYLMTSAVKLMTDSDITALGDTCSNNEIAILVATSGDTGKAALEGFKDIDGTKIIVFYPENGVSPLQKRQMVTQEGNNTCVIGVRGNFDDAQSAVKAVFADAELAVRLKSKGYTLSSANSINIGRLLPQIVYYYYAYAGLVRNGLPAGEAVDFVVPTGNFGNILAGYYAKRMGLPIGTLVCASNENRVLYDFFKTKVYDINRPFYQTSSPSMDILISSNFERLLHAELTSHYARHRDGGRVAHERVIDLTRQLSAAGRFGLNLSFSDFAGYYTEHDEVLAAISKVYNNYKYLIDPHTAVAYSAYEKHGHRRESVIVSTASPYKFTKTIAHAVSPENAALADIDLIEAVARLQGEREPHQIAKLAGKPIRHTKAIDKSEIKEAVMDILSIWACSH